MMTPFKDRTSPDGVMRFIGTRKNGPRQETVKDMHDWTANQGVSVEKDVSRKVTGGLPRPIIGDEVEEGLIDLFADLQYPVFKDNRTESVLMGMRLIRENRMIDTPDHLIHRVRSWGWPIAGAISERFTVFPWKIMKPVDAFFMITKNMSRLSEEVFA